MAKASLIGLITQGPELQHSAKGEPYVRFSVAEYVGFGLQRHTQFVDVWAWGYMAQRLAKCTLSNGDFILTSLVTSIQVQNEQEAKFETLNTHYHVKFSPLQAAVAASILMAVAA